LQSWKWLRSCHLNNRRYYLHGIASEYAFGFAKLVRTKGKFLETATGNPLTYAWKRCLAHVVSPRLFFANIYHFKQNIFFQGKTLEEESQCRHIDCYLSRMIKRTRVYKWFQDVPAMWKQNWLCKMTQETTAIPFPASQSAKPHLVSQANRKGKMLTN